MSKERDINHIERLSETALKNGSYNYLLGLMGFVMLILLGSLGYIIKQNSEAIQSIPKDITLLTVKFDSMEKKLDSVDRKLELIFYNKKIEEVKIPLTEKTQ